MAARSSSGGGRVDANGASASKQTLPLHFGGHCAHFAGPNKCESSTNSDLVQWTAEQRNSALAVAN